MTDERTNGETGETTEHRGSGTPAEESERRHETLPLAAAVMAGAIAALALLALMTR